MKNIPRIVIAAVSSGCGKTTIVSGILSALRDRGKVVQSYKIGPDYIDPGYHRLASGRAGCNLDTWLIPTEKITEGFCRAASDADIAIVEGVMGLYDGGRKGISSTASLAKQLDAPVVLVIDVKSMGDSAAAIALGFKTYDSSLKLAGVILNRVGSASHESMIREAMAKIDMPVFGAVYRNDALRMPERHLGLTPVTENDAIAAMATIKKAIAAQVDLPMLLSLAEAAPPLRLPKRQVVKQTYQGVRIGVARDEAFSFYYPESLDVLVRLGAELVFFRPLYDQMLPNVDGLIIGGGFPEMFAETLAANVGMRESILAAAQAGMPIYAECGGLMYLTESLRDFSGFTHEMIGLIPAKCHMNTKLQTVGYVEATALTDTLLCHEGEKMRGHEFHFSSMETEIDEKFPWAFSFLKTRTNEVYAAGYSRGNLLASYLHIHFVGNPAPAKNFLRRCALYKQGDDLLG